MGSAESKTPHNGIPAKASDTTQEKIARAMSAGPDDISKSARIVDTDAQGNRVILREAHKPKPTNSVPGITYMLAGATQRSDSDPYDATSPPITVGPHWMIMWPFDPKTTGLPTTHKATGAYIMWAGSPYAHVHIMGRP